MSWQWQALPVGTALSQLVQALNRRLKGLEEYLSLSVIPITFADGDATPSVGGAKYFRTANTGATTIADLEEGKIGQEVRIDFDDALTTIDFTGTTLTGNGGVDWTPGNGDFMVCHFDGTNWRCQVTEV